MFEESKSLEGIGKIFGFIAAYLFFTFIVLIILLAFDKILLDDYYVIFAATFSITLAGYIIKRLLK